MNGIKQDPDVKHDTDMLSPSGTGYMDDDFYEDTGELKLPEGPQDDIWLTRIPDWLWEAVSKFEDLASGPEDEHVVLGEVLAMRDPTRPGAISSTNPIRVFLKHRVIENNQLPQAFELKPTPAPKEVLANTYIFTESNLPGYKPQPYGQDRIGGFGVQDPKARVAKRGKYRKAIPKNTTLIGHAAREYNTITLPTKESIAFDKARIREAIQGSQETTNIAQNLDSVKMNQTANEMFANFVAPKQTGRPQTNKAARIPRQDLIDILHRCFDRYQYWTLGALRAETRQPEAYLKEVLTEVAKLVKSGPYASKWKRLGMYDTRNLAEMQDEAPDGGDFRSDDDMEMEDVIHV
ncbi:hypothetical protein M011DRAFT_464478 [Sporormia fimetaria CBS 119925]|uniref:Transcription initiation factor IIF subunit beta n=1 Tax=Sporormia fimetaria CBS 119925 TaxID=1340428 RepID=A0A6A6VM82_9PLEO|nr:hypothetical protein M011DRAFT_464478 [Sporormia fimetaria CBS 119925]